MKTDWPTVKIGEVCEPIKKWQPSKSGELRFTYVDLSSIDQEAKKVTDYSRLDCVDAPSRARQLVKQSDVLVSTVRPNLNAVSTVPQELDGATASTGFSVLRPQQSRLHDKFLFHWVRTNRFIGEMVRLSTGASYPAISDEIIKTSKIPLPPIEEQRRIASILDAADTLRTKRRQALAKLDTLTQAIFIDMFGDPVLNGKKWKEERKLGEVAEIRSGITKGRKVAGPTRSVPYMAVLNVQDGFLDLNTVKSIDATDKEIEKYRIRKGDLLLTEGGDPDKLGRGTVWNEEISESIHQNHIFRARITSSDFSPVFLSRLISSARGKRYFMRSAKQTTGIASINATQLRAFPLIEPPVDLQKQFELAVNRVSDFRSNVIVEQKIDKLFGSLQQKAFRGEL